MMIYICFYFYVILYCGPEILEPCNLEYDKIFQFFLQGKTTFPFALSFFYSGKSQTLLRRVSKSLTSNLIPLSKNGNEGYDSLYLGASLFLPFFKRKLFLSFKKIKTQKN